MALVGERVHHFDLARDDVDEAVGRVPSAGEERPGRINSLGPKRSERGDMRGGQGYALHLAKVAANGFHVFPPSYDQKQHRSRVLIKQARDLATGATLVCLCIGPRTVFSAFADRPSTWTSRRVDGVRPGQCRRACASLEPSDTRLQVTKTTE